MKKFFKQLMLVTAIVFVFIQLVPFGENRTNPPVRQEPAWDQPQTRVLVQRACFDCHSNTTRWPWYSAIAPASWMAQRHVEVGRHTLNFSEWNRVWKEGAEAAKSVQKGEMPPRSYLALHPEARLAAAEREQLIAGLRRTMGGAVEADSARRESEEGH